MSDGVQVRRRWLTPVLTAVGVVVLAALTSAVVALVGAGAATPVDRHVGVYGNCRTRTVEPRRIVLTCADYGVYFKHLRWSSWTASSARGEGALVYNDCTPSCAGGTFHTIRHTHVKLIKPVRDPHGRLVWSRIVFHPQPPGYATGPYHGGPEPLPIRPD